MTVDEAIRDLLSISPDIRRLVLLDADGTVLGAGPGSAGTDVAAALDGLWREAEAVAGAPLEHVVIDLGDAAVAALEAEGRRVVALTAPNPPVGLVVFDLRTCLADAFPAEAGEGTVAAGEGALRGAGDAAGREPDADPSPGQTDDTEVTT